MSIKYVVLVVMALGGATAVAVPDFPAYSVTDLKALGIWPAAMNQKGQVVGHACCGRQSAGALVYASGDVRDLGLPAGAFSGFGPIDLNDNGWVTGYAVAIRDQPVLGDILGIPALHDGVGWTVIDVSSLGQSFLGEGYPSKINNAGQVIGHAYMATGLAAWLFDRGTLIRLSPLFSAPTDINETGDVVGWDGTYFLYPSSAALLKTGWTWRDGQLTAFTGRGVPQRVNDAGTILTVDQDFNYPLKGAYVVEGEVTTPIPFIGCYSGQVCRMSPSAMNERGDVVGDVALRPGLPDEIRSAFLYRMGETTALGTLGGLQAAAQSLNNRGQVAGWSTDAQGRVRPFVYDDGVMLDVSNLRFVGAPMQLGNVNEIKVAINDGSYVLVIGMFNTGWTNSLGTTFEELQGLILQDAYLLTPVAPTVTMTVSPTQARVRQPVTLAWEAVNANSCVATGGVAGDGWTGTLATSGQMAISEVNPGTVQYGVRCTAGGLSGDAQVSATFQQRDRGGGRLDFVALLLIGMGLSRRAGRTHFGPVRSV